MPLHIADIDLTDHYLVGTKVEVKMSKLPNLRGSSRYQKLVEDSHVGERFKETMEKKYLIQNETKC